MLSTFEWLKRFKGEVVDYLLKSYFLETLKILEQLKDSEFPKTILMVDGLLRWTQLQLQWCLVLGEDKDDLPEVPIGCNNNKAGPSGMSNDTL